MGWVSGSLGWWMGVYIAAARCTPSVIQYPGRATYPTKPYEISDTDQPDKITDKIRRIW